MSNEFPSVMPMPANVPMTVQISVRVVDPQGVRHHVVGPTGHIDAMQRALSKQRPVRSSGTAKSDSAEARAHNGMSIREFRSNYSTLKLHLVDPQYGKGFDVDLTPFEHLGDESVVEVDYVYSPASGPVAMT